MSEATTQAAPGHRRRALEETVVLLAPSFGSWKGRYQLPRAKVEVQFEGETIDKDDVTVPQAKLMTNTYPHDRHGESWKKRFDKLKSRQSAAIEKYSVPFPIRGVRIVPKDTADEFLREVQDINRDLATAVDEFVDGLEDVLTEIKNNTDENVWKAVEHKIPKRRDWMRGKFYCDVVPIEMATAGDPTEVTSETLSRHRALVNEATTRKVEEAIESMIEGPRNQLAEALAGLREVINRNGRVTERSFKPVREAIAKVRAFSCVANDELLAEMATMEHRMRITSPTTLDQVTAANNGFMGAVEALMEEVEDAERQSADLEEFGKEFRGIQLD